MAFEPIEQRIAVQEEVIPKPSKESCEMDSGSASQVKSASSVSDSESVQKEEEECNLSSEFDSEEKDLKKL